MTLRLRRAVSPGNLAVDETAELTKRQLMKWLLTKRSVDETS